MKVDSTNTDRFQHALDLLQQGKAFEFSNIQFFVNSSANRFEVRSITRWQIGNLTNEIAHREVQRGTDVFEYLSTNSNRFKQMADGKEIRYSVVQDLGNAVVEICHLSGQRIVWS